MSQAQLMLCWIMYTAAQSAVLHVSSYYCVCLIALSSSNQSARGCPALSMVCSGMQLPCIPPGDKLITVGLPVSSTAIPFLTAARIVRKSLRLDRECCFMLLHSSSGCSWILHHVVCKYASVRL